MPKRLSAIVIGGGWAGEGHALALRFAGVDVVALCGRQQDRTRAVADRLEVPQASTDWRATLEAVRPDIVALGTPAALRIEVIEAAAALGCHLFCDKPLGTTAAEARCCYDLAHRAGVKHAYAATQRYDPSVAWLAELVREGSIGPLREISATLRMPGNRLMPWSWVCVLASGGGMLNNGLPHLLGIWATLTGGEPVRVMGEARVLRDRAPVLPGIHDFREWRAKAGSITPEMAETLEWRPCDADGAASALLRFTSPQGEVNVSFLIGPGIAAPQEAGGMRLYGESGTLVADGLFTYAVSRVEAGREPEALPVPLRLLNALPAVGDGEQNKWCALARDFVADIQGQAHSPYLNFRDGWRYQEAIDAIRSGRGWFELPENPPHA